MAFNDSDILKMAASALAGGVIDSSGSQYYEKRNPWGIIVDPENVWTDLPLLKDLPASTYQQAIDNWQNNPNLIDAVGINPDGTYNDATAIRLTKVAGSNGTTYIAYNNYNDPSGGVRKNWLQPQLIPQASGAASAQYNARIFIGPPSNGNLLFSSAGFDGNWVSHFWSPALGLLMIAPDDKPISAAIGGDDLYVCGFTYSGATASGGGFSGSTVLLEDPDGNWRIRNDYPILRFERKEYKEDGSIVWNTYQTIGHSVATDGITLSRPFDIKVARNVELNEDPTDPEYHSVFRVSGVDEEYVFGNSQDQTVIETARGTEIERADSVRDEVELENRPLSDVEIILDTTDNPVAGSFKEMSWVSNINYDPDTEFIRFNELGFEVIGEPEDNLGNPVPSAAIRLAVEDIDGNLIQETTSKTALDAGIDAGFNLKEGYHFYPVTPRYTDSKLATTITRIQLTKGYRIKLTGGNYDYIDPLDRLLKTQLVPRQKAKVEFLNHVHILDGSNFRDEVHKLTGNVIENGIHAYNEEFSDELYPLVESAQHTNAYMPVLGNYEDTTFLASGEGGVKVLFEDNTTRTQFHIEDAKTQIGLGETPQFFIETDEIELEVSGIFETELGLLAWEIVNVERFIPLIRQEGLEPIGYRVEVNSTVVDFKFQESQDKFTFMDGRYRNGYTINPTIDATEPEYVKLKLPRARYTVNRETPRKITYKFSEPVKVYGYYKDPTDPNDITTGTFVPEVKADVSRVYLESIVSGEDLESRLDNLEGDKEYQIALENNMPTLHLWPSKLVLADKDGEWLFFGDATSIYSDQDEFQYLYTTGAEAYFELEDTQGTWSQSNSVFTFNPVVVGVPTDAVAGFEVSFGWSDTFNNNGNLEYGVWTMFIDSNGRGFDAKITMNIPKNASVNWRFRRRRDGSFSYVATPFNGNLSSTWLGLNNDISADKPVDPSPPVQGSPS